MSPNGTHPYALRAPLKGRHWRTGKAGSAVPWRGRRLYAWGHEAPRKNQVEAGYERGNAPEIA
ncbi:hypothetical protein GCM10023144_03990 [Pigmentiphaga soli]|uniref:Uncharacterized protein n=1 Tax=Pigmentiphaga soli TaxID=1007095 RepID=A0ABP8GFR9_9BURK